MAVLISILWGTCPVSSSSQDLEIIDISFVDALHGWVLAEGPPRVIFRTSDGGKSWHKFPLPPESDFYHFRFWDQNNGMAVQFVSENEMAIHRTTDAGQTWVKASTVKAKYGEHIVDLLLTSAEEGFVVGEGEVGRGYVAQILNGGKTLRTREDLPADFAAQSNALTVFGDRTGHLWIGGKELILHSADNGNTWENQYANTKPRFDMAVGGFALPGGHAWLAVANFEIYKTDDYGKHWVRVLSTSSLGLVNFDAVSFSNPREGCAAGNSAYVYCTSDGGVSWNRTRVFTSYLNGTSRSSWLQLFPSSHGWASVGGALYKTEDGGRSFTEILTSSGNATSDVPGESLAMKTAINGPTDLAFDYAGYLYIVESEQGRISRLNVKRGTMRIVVPEPEFGLYADFDFPSAIATDQRGHLLIADFNGRLRSLNTKTGEISVLLPAARKIAERPLDNPAAMAIEGNGNALIADRRHKILRWYADSQTLMPIIQAQIRFPDGVAVNPAGDILVADYENCLIRKFDSPTGSITTIAGTGECASKGDGGPAVKAALNYPSSLVTDKAGNIYFIEGPRVRRIDDQGTITTYAGSEEKGSRGDGGPATGATFINPSGLALDSEGNLYIADFVSNRIRRVDAKTKIITTVAGNGRPHRIEVIM
ncbi:MAG TPA: YCF48-related protein [Candidatus Nitrosotenuis sp.]|nr:YCF48-related protein [Candidatus Nitrosotenuis sp.]